VRGREIKEEICVVSNYKINGRSMDLLTYSSSSEVFAAGGGSL
jgi:hypothetical protein